MKKATFAGRFFISGSRDGSCQRRRDARLQRRSEEHTSELQSPCNLVCRLLLEKKKEHELDRRVRNLLRSVAHDRHPFAHQVRQYQIPPEHALRAESIWQVNDVGLRPHRLTLTV